MVRTMGRITDALKSLKPGKKSAKPKRKSAATLKKRALDRWENEGGPPAPE